MRLLILIALLASASGCATLDRPLRHYVAIGQVVQGVREGLDEWIQERRQSCLKGVDDGKAE